MMELETLLRPLPRGRVALGLLLCSLTLTQAGCARGRLVDNPFESPTSSQSRVAVRVENRNLHDATLYLRVGGRRVEVGSVRSREVQFFDVPLSSQQPLDLEIELSVGERYRLPPFPYSGGGRLEMVIAPELRQSSIRR